MANTVLGAVASDGGLEPANETPANNTLTAAEKADGWELLFDGKTTAGWRGVHLTKFPKDGWAVENGVIKHLATAQLKIPDGGDIVTTADYEHFDLRFEFLLKERANSGIKYLVDETKNEGEHGLGFEYQILDDANHPDAKRGKNGNRTMGSLYDLIPATNKTVNPIGTWNQGRLVVNGNQIQHFLNGKLVVSFVRESPEIKKIIAGSKYADIPWFGNISKGQILLQDHGDEVWFRNLKIRRLP